MLNNRVDLGIVFAMVLVAVLALLLAGCLSNLAAFVAPEKNATAETSDIGIGATDIVTPEINDSEGNFAMPI